MIVPHKRDIWGAWVKLLKSKGVPPPEDMDMDALDVWCKESSKDPQIRARRPYKVVIRAAMAGRLAGLRVDSQLASSTEFGNLLRASAAHSSDDSDMLLFLGKCNIGFDRDLRKFYDRLTEGIRIELVAKFDRACEEDSLLHETQEFYDKLISGLSTDLQTKEANFSEFPFRDEEVSTSLEEEASEIEDLRKMLEEVNSTRRDLQSSFAITVQRLLLKRKVTSLPDFPLDRLSEKSAEKIRSILEGRSESNEGDLELLSEWRRERKEALKRHIEKSDIMAAELIEAGDRIIETVGRMRSD